jgi:hypothetical protein
VHSLGLPFLVAVPIVALASTPRGTVQDQLVRRALVRSVAVETPEAGLGAGDAQTASRVRPEAR